MVYHIMLDEKKVFTCIHCIAYALHATLPMSLLDLLEKMIVYDPHV